MCSMKRFQLAALFLVAAVPLSGTPALAAGGTSNTALTCAVDPADPDYGASGVAKLSHVQWSPPSWWMVAEGELSVTCRNLTPGANYALWSGFGWVPGGTFTAGPRGNGSASGWVGFHGLPLEVIVIREDGTWVLVGTITR
jgi:hypothetical protein